MRKSNRIAAVAGLAAFAFMTVPAGSAHALFVGSWYDSATSTVSNAYTAAKETASAAVDSVKSTAFAASTWIQEKAEGAKTFVVETVKVVVAKAKEVAGKVWTAVTKTVTTGINYAKQGFAALKAGASALGAKVVAGAKAVGNAILNAVDFIKKYAGQVLDFVKGKYSQYAPVVQAKLKELASKGLDALAAQLTQKYPDAAAIIAKVRAGDFLGGIGEAAVLAANKGRPKLIDFLTDKAMTVLHPYLVKANGFLVGLALKLIRSPVSTAIATAVATTVASAAAAATAGVGGLLGPVLQPLTKVTADSLLDWVIEKVKGKLGELLFEKTKPVIKSHVIKPLVDKAFTALHGLLAKKFPRVFKGTALNTAD